MLNHFKPYLRLLR